MGNLLINLDLIQPSTNRVASQGVASKTEGFQPE